MDRRRFLLTSLAGALATPVAARAQQAGKVYSIGALWTNPAPRGEDVLRQGLRELGWVADPVGSGLVGSLARPGGNITGIAGSGPQLFGKHIELLKDAVPSLSRLGILMNSAFSFHVAVRPVVEAAAQNLNLRLTFVEVRTPEDIDRAFAEISREKLGYALILPQPLAFTHRARLAQLALAHRVVTMVAWREAVEAGALMAYSEPIVGYQRRIPHYIDRILRGAKPADITVELPTKFELTINLKTAKALGLTIPPSLLAQADQVIE